MTELQTIQNERRQRRSNSPLLAIGYQLDQVVEDFHLDCVLIVDESGAIQAASPDAPCEFQVALQSLLPSLATLPEARSIHLNRLRQLRPDLNEDNLSTCVFRAGGRRLYIGAVGPEAVMNEVAIFRAITGTRRIL